MRRYTGLRCETWFVGNKSCYLASCPLCGTVSEITQAQFEGTSGTRCSRHGCSFSDTIRWVDYLKR